LYWAAHDHQLPCDTPLHTLYSFVSLFYTMLIAKQTIEGQHMNEAERAAGLAETAKYKYADRVGNQLFIAGQVPHDADGQLINAENPYAQSTQCLNNLHKLLAVHDFATSDIRQLVVYVVGEHPNLSAAWSAVKDWFGDQVPPATLLGVARLGYVGQLVEIDATIIKA
jgi:enamine deaminase RidA (YjgF/YER057c/UK114 family)